MKQNIVIKVNMSSEKSRSKAMALVAKVEGVSSMGVIGDGRDRLEVVGVGVDVVRLVTCLRKKLGYADIVTVEEAKDTPEETVCDFNHRDCTCRYGHYYCRHHNNF